MVAWMEMCFSFKTNWGYSFFLLWTKFTMTDHLKQKCPAFVCLFPDFTLSCHFEAHLQRWSRKSRTVNHPSMWFRLPLPGYILYRMHLKKRTAKHCSYRGMIVFFLLFLGLKKQVSTWGEHHTSWKSWDISHTKQEFDCISHLCLSERKKSRSSGVCVRAWTIQFMKQVLPRFISPRRPAGQKTTRNNIRTILRWPGTDSIPDTIICFNQQ